MAPRKFNKNNSTTFSLVYRAQNDPRIHDAEASDMVFTEKATRNGASYDPYGYGEPAGPSSASVASNRSKIQNLSDLSSEFGDKIRSNEGEAASYGIYYDDSEYDYMQHMRDLGSSSAYFIEAAPVKGKGKNKGKNLEDALRSFDLDDSRSSIASSQVSAAASEYFDEDMLPSEFVKRTNYQDMQDVPDAIAGFQPDMDPRLREVLEALDDEEYVDDDDDLFANLQEGAEEVDQAEFEDDAFDDDDEGWESDHTVKAGDDAAKGQQNTSGLPRIPVALEPNPDEPLPEDHGDGDWMAAFAKAKRDAIAAKAVLKSVDQPRLNSSAQRRLDLTSVHTGASSLLSTGRKKKRKGAMTSSSGYSMSSSVLSRTEGQSILDRRFDKIEEEYASDDDDEDGGAHLDDTASMVSGMSRMSAMSGMSNISAWSSASKRDQGPTTLRSDFGDIMDDFLGNYSKVGNRQRHVRRGKPASGMQQLDEIRNELRGPRIQTQVASSKGG